MTAFGGIVYRFGQQHTAKANTTTHSSTKYSNKQQHLATAQATAEPQAKVSRRATTAAVANK